jgi:RiboL-PSP-HEPN
VSATVVHRLHGEFVALTEVLKAQAESSLQVTADDIFRKALLLAAASYFETAVSETIIAFAKRSTGERACIVAFVKAKGITRQFHTLFDWDAANANRFFSLFGEEFKQFAAGEIARSKPLAESVKAFLELGQNRNRLVHEDFGQFTMEKTEAEIFALFEAASVFVAALPALLERGCASSVSEP